MSWFRRPSENPLLHSSLRKGFFCALRMPIVYQLDIGVEGTWLRISAKSDCIHRRDSEYAERGYAFAVPVPPYPRPLRLCGEWLFVS